MSFSAALAGPAIQQMTGAVSKPPTLLDVTLEDLAGKPMTLRDFAGEAYVLHYWATWCTPCIAELPALAQMQQAYKGSALKFVVVSLDGTNAGPKIMSFLARYNLQGLETYVDPTMAGYSQIRAGGVPVTLFIDQNGKELSRNEGPVHWSEPETRKALDSMLPPKK